MKNQSLRAKNIFLQEGHKSIQKFSADVLISLPAATPEGAAVEKVNAAALDIGYSLEQVQKIASLSVSFKQTTATTL